MLMMEERPQVMEIKVEQQNDYFMQKRMELMIEVANKKLVAEIQKLREEVQRLEKEVIELRRKASHTTSAPVQAYAQPAAVAMPAQAPARPMDFTPEKKVSQDVPRYGHYTSADVSIEKFFNFGTGRKK